MTLPISIDYHTQNIPAPYSFSIHAELIFGDTTEVKFNLTYTDREELGEEDILNEGFSGEDNIVWSGILPKTWGQSLEDLISKTTWSAKTSKLSRCRIKVTLPEEGFKYPANWDGWEYWLQELQQACIETAKIEKPLEMDWVKGDKKLCLRGSFEKREASIEDRSLSFHVSKSIPWDKLGKLLKQIYIAEYHPEGAVTNYSSNGDAFLNIGGGQWYNLSKTDLQLHKKQEWLSKLEASFEDLLTGPSA